MFPLRDNIPSRTFPFVNYIIMGICCIAFLIQSIDSSGILTMQFAMIPLRISQPDQPIVVEVEGVVQTSVGVQPVVVEKVLPPGPIPPWMTVITCVFLHGSLMHLLGNMWFLYIFGDNVEDRLGHVGFVVFYLVTGAAASLSHFLIEPGSEIPTVGASGAIAGVMGAYLLFYPHARVMTLIPIAFFLQMMVVPAPIFLGLWFVLQLIQGTFSIGAAHAAGVAWWAHIGGFVAGLLIAWFMNRTNVTHPQVRVVRPGTERSGMYRIR
ncbi:MAG: rhomboid family intramembrane serine protease [Planctomyces sp.]|nr:rhomboid family intramembrane serine protease [Planctomyces sp.]